MSTAARATHAASKKVGQNVARPTQLIHYTFEPNPKPINCCTYFATKTFAEEVDHPLHIQTQRRLEAFDADVLHWTVKCSLELSKKAVVRNWAVRRVKEAFRAELRKKGWNKDGTPNDVVERRRQLKGALCIRVNKNKHILEANGEEVRNQCSWVLRKVVEAQGNGERNVFRRER